MWLGHFVIDFKAKSESDRTILELSQAIAISSLTSFSSVGMMN
ncbi:MULTISPECIES: hypothetical protein [unclassified Nostoc]|nr:hypothetical protein [Nostoc sp. 'Peltigera membranacea cyanobiont' 232]